MEASRIKSKFDYNFFIDQPIELSGTFEFSINFGTSVGSEVGICFSIRV